MAPRLPISMIPIAEQRPHPWGVCEACARRCRPCFAGPRFPTITRCHCCRLTNTACNFSTLRVKDKQRRRVFKRGQQQLDVSRTSSLVIKIPILGANRNGPPRGPSESSTLSELTDLDSISANASQASTRSTSPAHGLQREDVSAMPEVTTIEHPPTDLLFSSPSRFRSPPKLISTSRSLRAVNKGCDFYRILSGKITKTRKKSTREIYAQVEKKQRALTAERQNLNDTARRLAEEESRIIKRKEYLDEEARLISEARLDLQTQQEQLLEDMRNYRVQLERMYEDKARAFRTAYASRIASLNEQESLAQKGEARLKASIERSIHDLQSIRASI